MDSGKAIRVGAVVLVALLVGGWPNAAGPDSFSVRQNLDLPYNAGGVSEEDEEAPDIIFLYGGMYEANAVVFCLDESLTMNGEDRFGIQRREATRAVSELSDRTEFGIIFYGARVHSFRNQLVTANGGNKAAANAFIASRSTNLGTCTGPAVVKALRLLQNSSLTHKAVIVVSDGQPTTCPFTPVGGCEGQKRINRQVLSEIRAATSSRITIHTVLVGRSDICGDGFRFMRTMASGNGGTYRKVSQ